jgi:hypothetical protein
MAAKAGGKGFFQINSGGSPEQYLNEKRAEIETLNSREKLCAQTVLLVAQTICIVLDTRDAEMLQVLKEELDKLFAQADEILKSGVHKVQ